MESVGQTRTARVERTSNGIVIIRILPEIVQDVRDAAENLRASAEAGGGKKPPLLVDIREAAALDAETRHYYTGEKLIDSFVALALLVPIGAFGKMMGNLYLRVARPGIPSQLFSGEEDALKWLKQHLT